MKYAIISQAPEALARDTKSFAAFVKSEIQHEKRDILRQSKRFMNFKVSIGHNGDDIIYNSISVRIVGDLYKINRIIKNSLVR